MKLFSSAEQLIAQGGWRGVVCIGNFDGVHLGHVGLLHCAKALGPVLVLTFEPHPVVMLFPERAPKRIATPERKLALLAQQGVMAVVSQSFDASFASTSAAQFERLLFSDLGAHAIAIGANFTYGAGRCGNVQTLQEASRRLKGKLFIFPELKIEGKVVSSSQIRRWVASGNIEEAKVYLGRPFELEGEVVEGQKRGRAMGFPTANICCADMLTPKPGVYAVQFSLDSQRLWRGGVANLGYKPTFAAEASGHASAAAPPPSTALSLRAELEVHVLEASGEWYGEKATIRFLSRLRDERRFASVEALKEQIRADIIAAKPFLKP
ncbi:MAG: riboflavin biosynthesis protein RibF [Cystobacterineae bacterium]|nr:riboflavin biosynthesis protein RibF [Cystobacterineae bacterium]